MADEEKKKHESTMTEEEKSKCHKIIHTAAGSAAAIGFGLAQIPGSDAIPITTIQIGMIVGLGAVFGTEVTEAAAKAILGGAAAAIGGRTVSQFLVGWIPVLGNPINAATAFTITEGIGWYVADDFADDAQKRKEEIIRLEKERKEAEERRIKLEKEAEARRIKIEEERRKAELEQKRKEEEQKRKDEEARRIKFEEERRKAELEQKQREEEIRRLEQKNKEAEARKQSTRQMIISFAACVLLAAICTLVCVVLYYTQVSSPLVNIVSGTVIVIIVNALVYLMCLKHITELMQIAQALFPLNFIAGLINVAVSLIYFFKYEAEAIAVLKGLKADIGWVKLIIEFLVAFWNTPSPFLNHGLVIVIVCWFVFLVGHKYTTK